MTPRLAEILAAMAEAVLAADVEARPAGRGTIRRPEPIRRPPAGPGKKAAGAKR